ncbi:MAG: fused MFS/spermidine synthase [Chloroflexi bacterium]|nr:fused MFS/spermidine synthase [Chloroflexota bacterium]
MTRLRMEVARPDQPSRAALLTTSTGLLGLLVGSLVLSGASGLIYQVVWFRLLGTIFGVTIYATSAVLAAFMAGLALGSLLAARVADRVRRPLLAYALVEVAIGGCGFASLWALDQLQPLYQALATSFTDSVAVLAVVRFCLAFGILLVPTTLMGATLPLVVRSSLLRAGSLSRHVSLLYAANTFGAVAGVVVSAFYLIGTFGLTVTTLVAASFNVGVGLLWLLLALPAEAARWVQAPAEPPAVPELEPRERLTPALARMVLVIYALSGAIALAYEVVWTRLLAGVFPSTVYAFALMLVAILSGIALGSWAVTATITRPGNWLARFALLEAAIGVVAVLSLVAIAQVYRVDGLLRGWLGWPVDALVVNEPWFMLPFALLAIGPAAFLMGVAFPVATRLYASGFREVGQRVGLLYGANVLGALVGSLGGGLVLIPWLGAQRALWALALGNAALGLVLLAVSPLRRRQRLVLAGGVVGTLALGGLVVPDVYHQLFTTDPQTTETVWFHEGPDANVRVARDREGNLVLFTNSAGQNNDSHAEAVFHYQLGLLGPLLHPQPREVLVVGLGIGQTAGAASVHPGVHVTAIELLRGVIEALPLFEHVNFSLDRKPNVSIVEADGRNYLLLAGQRFDVIESDPIWPTHAGAANLYSVDYYRLVRAALKDDGIAVQWVDASLPEPAYKMMVRSFYAVFPEATMWFHGTVLVGTKGPLRLDYDAIEAKFADPALRALLADLGIRSVNDLKREFVARPEEVRAYLGPGPVISDRFPVIEYVNSLPSGTLGADLRWRRVATYLAARERPGDAIAFSEPATARAFRTFHPARLTEFVPPDGVTGREAEIAAALQDLLARHERLWFIPWWQNASDQFFERWLNANAYQAVNRLLGNIRVQLYLSAQGEPPLQPTEFVFGDQLAVRGWALDRFQAAPGDGLRVALQLHALRDLSEDLKVIVRLVGPEGQTFATSDRLPRDATTVHWRAGGQLLERRAILIPPGTPPGRYRLDLDVYRAEDGQRLPPRTPNAPGQRVILAEVTVTEATRQFPAEAVEADQLSSVVFGEVVRLAGFSLDLAPRRPGDEVEVALFWQQVTGGSRQVQLLIGNPNRPAGVTAFAAGQPTSKAGAISRQDLRVRIRPGTLPGRYDLWLLDAAQSATHEWLGRIDIVAPPALPTPAAPALAIGQRFDERILLEGLTLQPLPGGLEVTLVWQALADIPQDYVVFVHLLEGGGAIVAQSDQRPAGGLAPTGSWLPGQRVEDRHRLTVAAVPPAARLAIGLYDLRTGRRLPTAGGDAVLLALP